MTLSTRDTILIDREQGNDEAIRSGEHGWGKPSHYYIRSRGPLRSIVVAGLAPAMLLAASGKVQRTLALSGRGMRFGL